MNTKITPINGFDKRKNNARQNNYAWSMVEFDGYIYVGTGRNIAALGLDNYGFQPLDKIMPPVMSHLAEIWRYPLNDEEPMWEFCYRVEASSKIYGFRDMIVYTDATGLTAICAGCVSLDKSKAYTMYSTDGMNWQQISSDMPAGYNSRAFFEFDGVLYCGTNNTLGGEQSDMLMLTDYSQGFSRLPLPEGEGNPKGSIMSMAEMNGQLYIGTATGKGFGIWRTADPLSGAWTLVVDHGAGEQLNEWAMTMKVFRGGLYIGSAITGGTISVDPQKKFVPFKGFDLIRVDMNDNWEVIVGKKAINPIEPTKGERNNGLYSPGFGNAFNCYCWQMEEYNNRLYVASWDAALLYKDIIINEIRHGGLKNLRLSEDESEWEEQVDRLLEESSLEDEHYRWLRWMLTVVKSLPRYPRQHGFDLYVSEDGLHFKKESLNGFENKKNYGLRTMLVASDGKFYLGTANVYEGCEVWAMETERPASCCHCCRCGACCEYQEIIRLLSQEEDDRSFYLEREDQDEEWSES